jgi:TPR repeat protein
MPGAGHISANWVLLSLPVGAIRDGMRGHRNTRARSFSLLIILVLSGVTPRCQQQPATQRALADVSSQPANSAQSAGYFALVIGNSQYKSLHPLETPAADAAAIARMLKEQFGFQTQVLLDANRAQILKALADFHQSLSENSNLLIYYAGHGYLDPDSREAYWLPIDANKENQYDWISADDVITRIRAIRSKHVLVISDSCYSGAILSDDSGSRGERLDNGDLVELAGLASRSWMASGSLEPVADDGAPGHSVFAGALLQGFAKMKGPQFAASDLFYSFVRRKVAGNAPQLPQYGLIRNSGDQLGDFIFARTGSAPASLPGNSHPAAGTDQPEVPKTGREMSDLGSRYEHGAGGLTKDDVQAVSWYRKAADAGDARGMTNLGMMYEHGRGGLPRDDVQAVSWFRKGAEAGRARGMTLLGWMYEHGRGGLAKDDVQAASWYRKGADAGDGLGMADLGEMYEYGRGLVKDEAQAVSWYRKAADAGDGHGMTNLGFMYEHGRGGLPKDDVQAVSWYRKAADAGDGRAMANLGVMYGQGRGGLAKDDIQAVSWLRKAADAGDGRAMSNLGVMYQQGRGGLAKDDVQAVSWYRKSADAGDSFGMANLGLSYEFGQGGLPKDDVQAVSWYRKSADAGDGRGMYELGWMYQQGRGGLPKDVARAADWYGKAAAAGEQDASVALKKLQQ